MTNYRAIAIGINQYQQFQPLYYAERDAQDLHQTWVEDMGFAPQQTKLLADSSPDSKRSTAYPNRLNIIESLTDLCQTTQADDGLWVFFSGYGATLQGHDYLLPIDADPSRIPETGIAVEALFSLLRAAATRNILILLDMNRSQGTLAGSGAGAQTLALAQDFGMPTILSCRPDEFSHETLVLRHGLFTQAVLEGLRQEGCATTAHLVQFLGDRLPQLSEHHCRPVQHPIAAVPEALRYQLLLPGKPSVPADPDSEEANLGLPVPPDLPEAGASLPPNGEGVTEEGAIAPPPDAQTPEPPPVDDLTWQRWLKIGGSALAALLLLVLARNIPTVMQSPTPVNPPSESPDAAPSPQATEPSTPESPDATGEGTTPNAESEVPSAPLAPASPDPAVSNEAPTPPTSTELPPVGQQPGNTPARQPEPRRGLFGNLFRPPAEPSPTEASAPASPAPPASRTSASSSSNDLDSESGVTADLDSAERAFAEARAMTQDLQVSADTQVSRLAEAIQRARQVPADHGYYADAQQEINRWSQMMLDVAELRSVRPNGGNALTAAQNFAGAIAAAQLIPTDRPGIRALADESIARWSGDMMDLAELQAYWGDPGLAIAVAQQVPAQAPKHGDAQQAIANWQVALEQQRIAAQQDPFFPEEAY
ncbi:MAG: caspase family protein [Kaiparowitsia implicata GSE-PSE-MK54-09C]|nr:caspase family protein [Kaiparowitsia implicata GSE-PSE-MK54-09C]